MRAPDFLKLEHGCRSLFGVFFLNPRVAIHKSEPTNPSVSPSTAIANLLCRFLLLPIDDLLVRTYNDDDSGSQWFG